MPQSPGVQPPTTAAAPGSVSLPVGGDANEAPSSDTSDSPTATATAADLDALRRAEVEARARRRLTKNLILVGICLLLLGATLWVLLVVGPL